MHQLAREVSEKKRYLSELVAVPVDNIARACLPVLNDLENLDRYLQQAIQKLPHCTLIYVTDRCYCQLSSNVRPDKVDSMYRGQNHSQRPYLQATIPLQGLVLSNNYEDSYTLQPCITLVQAIQQDGELVALLMADFNLNELHIADDVTRIMGNWQQFKGDPAIRGSLFSQQRTSNQLDMQINKVHAVVQTLVIKYGVFHFKLHYSSARITLWLYDRPHHYCLHNIEDLLNEKIFSLYQLRSYPEDASVEAHKLGAVLNQFRALRFADDNIYLRSGSVNIINSMVGLNFSCDGSHYIPTQEFIDNSMDYWLGTA